MCQQHQHGLGILCSQALPCKRQVADASVTNRAHQLLVREGSFDGRGGRLSAAQVGRQAGWGGGGCRLTCQGLGCALQLQLRQ